jgi:flagellar basal body rod protein FlgB
MSASPTSVIDQISASMSITSLRHQVIASNISNRDAQGYQRMKLSFDQAMGASPVPHVVADRTDAGASVEQDLIDLSSNAMRYEAMARALSRYFAMVGAITGSRS